MNYEPKHEKQTVGEGVKFQRIRRITGYLVGDLSRFNNAKHAEVKERVKHGVKKSVTLMVLFCMVFGCFAIPSNAATKTSKYVKVKRATYLKYKKAYQEAPKLKKEIKELKARKPETIVKTVVEKEEFDTSEYDKKIADLQAQVESLSNENTALKEQLNNIGPNDDIDELKHRLEQQEGINDWLWMSLSSLGISYSNKIWSIPETFPQTFIINGAKYRTQIVREEQP